jgi:hypothetical protein
MPSPLTVSEIINKKTEMQKNVDKSVCTVISGVPFRFSESKPGLFPIGLFTIPPVKEIGQINSLIINEGFYFRYVGEGKSIEQYEKAPVIANSVVMDYVNAQIGVNITDFEEDKHARPAIFWVFGSHTNEEARAYFKTEIELALLQQRQWFNALVQIADDDWAKNHMHRGISDLQRYAAHALNLRKEWMNPAAMNAQPDVCPACKSMIPGGALICQICRTIINREAYEKLNLKQAV